jgi:hypothetical protein
LPACPRAQDKGDAVAQVVNVGATGDSVSQLVADGDTVRRLQQEDEDALAQKREAELAELQMGLRATNEAVQVRQRVIPERILVICLNQ